MWKLWCAVFLFITLIQVIYLVWMWRNSYKKSSVTKKVANHVSIIICAKNEAQNLKEHIPHWCTQRFDGLYEVIIINDQSTDDSVKIIQQFQQKYPHLKYYTNPKLNGFPGKKSALHFGIQQAQFDYVLLTDADCKPQSELWLTQMSQYNDRIVLGFGDYEPHRALLNKWIRWETLHTYLQYTTYAQSNISYMGVGRNIAYPKSSYFDTIQNQDFLKTYTSVPSGDDDLLVQAMCKKLPTEIIKNESHKTISKAPNDWNSYWKQKQRHTSTGKYYQTKLKYLLGLYGLSHGLFWGIGIPQVIYIIYKWYAEEITCGLHYFNDLNLSKFVIFAFAFKIILSCSIQERINKDLKSFKTNTFFLYAVGDFTWAIYNLLIAPYIFIKNKQRWK